MTSRTRLKARQSTELDDVPPLSQNSDDGMTAALVQQIQSSMDKKKKEKEAQYFQSYKNETAETIAGGLTQFNDHCDQLDETFDKFLLDYAKAEDEIRAIWIKLIKAHAPFTAKIRGHLVTETQQDKEREDEQVLAIAYQRKSEEYIARTMASFLEPHGE